MKGAFLLVVRRQAVGGDHADDPAPTASELGFEPGRSRDWTDASGRVSVRCWAGGDDGTEAVGWWVQGPDIHVMVGHLVWDGRLHEAGGPWMSTLSDRALADPALAPAGMFAAAAVAATGDGWLAADPLGARCLYLGERDGTLAVGSRPALVARALARRGTRPTRVADSARWQAFTGFQVGDSTGYAGVRVLEPGRRLVLRSGRPSWEQSDPLEVAPDDPLRSRSTTERADLLQEDVAASLLAITASSQDLVVRLTGGKDSRLLLAIALRAGLARPWAYETFGPPALADVQVAAELCADLGLAHEARFIGLRPEEPFDQRFRQFVLATGGMVNGWDVGAEADPRLLLTGLCGELLRTYQRVPVALDGPDLASSTFARRRFGHLGLLRPDLADELHRDLIDRVAAFDGGRGDVVQRFFSRSRMRFTRLGPQEEVGPGRRLAPLYSWRSARIAMSMPWEDRQSELLFAEVIRAADPRLVSHRFAGSGWDDRARAHLGLAPLPPPAPRAPGTPSAPPGGPSLVQTLYAKAGDERTELLEELFADAHNPAWDLLDRTAARTALGRYASLTAQERRELFGAATTLVWLGR